MKTLLGAAVLATALALAPAAPAVADTCTPDTAVHRDIAYHSVPGVAPRLLSLDVYPAAASSCGENPVVVWVHGGGWRRGDKANNVADKIAWAHEHGWTFVSVNYRLTDPWARRVWRYPTHNRDVGRALTWVREHVDGYGGDPDRIGLMGHSAGAQIVASVGVDDRYLGAADRSAIGCVAALDTEGYDVEAVIAHGGTGERIYRAAFGHRRLVWRDASPIRHVSADDPPFFLVRRGGLARQVTQLRFADALHDAGVDASVTHLPGYSHGDVNTAVGVDDLETPALTAFFTDCFSA